MASLDWFKMNPGAGGAKQALTAAGLADQYYGGGGTNQTSFTGNMYSNPQMGAYGGTTGAMMAGGGSSYTPPGYGISGGGTNWWETPQSYPQPHGLSPTMADYYAGFSSPNDLWSAGSPSGHRGQEWNFNPWSGQGEWVNSTEGLQLGGSKGTGQNNAFVWIDPISGMKSIDPSKLSSMFDQLGGGNAGYDPYQMTDFQGGQITPPSAYGGGDWSTPDKVNVQDVIESYRPTMEAEIGAGFAQAGNRLGQSGFAMSTPYAQQLGEVERLARAQMNQRTLEYGYSAAEQDAARQMAAMMAQNAEKFGGWQQQGNWDMAAQQGNVGNALQQWMLENQLGFQGNQAQNLYNQQNQMNQQQFLASLLGGLI